ncbi:MAG: amidohydrolase/deacetylase family metallohydrolase [Balneolaceae bacterium]
MKQLNKAGVANTSQPTKRRTVGQRVRRWTGLMMALVLFPLAMQAQQIDLLIKGGHVVDPKNGINQTMDVAVIDGKIAEVSRSIDANRARRVADAEGLYVVPGLIDMHTHIFFGTEEVGYSGFEINNSFGSVRPDAFAFRTGVTTMVDAGSSGWRDLPTFRKQTVEESQARILAFVSIAEDGMLGSVHSNYLDGMQPDATAFMINENDDFVVGIKAHHYRGDDFGPVERAVEAGNLAGVPVMVDFGGHQPPLSLETLLMEKLRPGDILTHTHFGSSSRQGAIDESGNLRDFILPAQDRGIIFDVGHGAGGFQWDQAIPGSRQGFWPNTISTDLYRNSMNAGMKNLNNVMSKFLAIGMSLEDVIERVTWKPAQVLQREELGHLSVGAEADIAVLQKHEGSFGFLDARGQRVEGDEKLETELTVRAGRIVYDLNGISAPDWVEPTWDE